MKAFARLFFALGLLTALYLYVFPDALKFVSIPADDSMLHKAEGSPSHAVEMVEAQTETPTVVSA